MRPPVTLRDLYDALREKLGLKWIAGRSDSGRKLKGEFPGAASQNLAGTLNCIQVIGHAELVYFIGLEENFYIDITHKLFDAQPTAILLADGIEVGSVFIDQAESIETPLPRSSLSDHRLINDLPHYRQTPWQSIPPSMVSLSRFTVLACCSLEVLPSAKVSWRWS
ncbi:hypothetical protein [Candidatus Vondammii sp. HM_W22]|uniref:hypothetical protein n=1 Tax=Candidatus Vondammii sp. HM_W22 TaxID=2687299 RepID=UPI001F145332|nr:hypothetical protein [Candidatus Vondammii sp. HM_W22]